MPPGQARRKPVDILSEVLAGLGVPVPYKEVNGIQIVDAVLLLQTAEMRVGIASDSAARYLDRVVAVAEQLGIAVFEPLPLVAPVEAATRPPPVEAEAAPAAAAAPSAAAAAPSVLDSVAAAARDKMKAAHSARVLGLLTTTGDRLIFGRNQPEKPLKKFEEAMNVAARELLEADHDLIRFDGTVPRVGPLTEAARVKANALYTFSKAKGSRAQGSAGVVGARETPRSGSSLSAGGASSSGASASSSGASAPSADRKVRADCSSRHSPTQPSHALSLSVSLAPLGGFWTWHLADFGLLGGFC